MKIILPRLNFRKQTLQTNFKSYKNTMLVKKKTIFYVLLESSKRKAPFPSANIRLVFKNLLVDRLPVYNF
jgi:hypothetical protein